VPGPPFPSTGLLDEIVGSALEPGYRAQADRSGGARHVGRSWWVPVGAALLGLLVAMAALQARAAQPEAAVNRQELADRVAAESADISELQQRATQLRASVSALQRQALLAGDADAEQLLALETAAASLAVSGPAVVVVLDDAADPTIGEDPALSRVLDSDLQGVANGLFASGAEAVAINGQRLSSLSAIRGAGEAILVNYRPLTRPYRVEAIGDPRRLEAEFAASPAGTAMRTLADSYGIRADLDSVASVTLPAASVATLRVAEVAP
jgi:uncharacterized protein YlxW (UPF0749 family)